MPKPRAWRGFQKKKKGYSYLMLFWDGVKIDLTLLPLEVLDEYFTWDKLVKLLLDKIIVLLLYQIPTVEDYYRTSDSVLLMIAVMNFGIL